MKSLGAVRSSNTGRLSWNESYNYGQGRPVKDFSPTNSHVLGGGIVRPIPPSPTPNSRPSVMNNEVAMEHHFETAYRVTDRMLTRTNRECGYLLGRLEVMAGREAVQKIEADMKAFIDKLEQGERNV